MGVVRVGRGQATVLLLALFQASWLPYCLGDTKSDAAVLIAFKAGLPNFQDVYDKKKWKGWGADENVQAMCTSWTGVTCGANNTVTALNLAGMGLTGPLSRTLANLPDLALLDLSGNTLTGTLPSTVTASGQVTAVSWSSTMTKLQILKLQGVSGTFPREWGTDSSFPELLYMEITNSSMAGTLPKVWGQTKGMAKLTTLVASNNSLAGILPPEWGSQLKSLQSIDVKSNQIIGSLPESWAALPLVNISASFNQLTGTLPSAWGAVGSVMNLRNIILLSNGLTGTLPAAWGSGPAMANLLLLALSGNDLSGSIPAEWAQKSLAFPALRQIFLKPGNDGLCGDVTLTLAGLFADTGAAFTSFNTTCPATATAAALPPATSAGSTAVADKAALTQFFNGLTNSATVRAARRWTGWGFNADPVCAWTGVTCDTAGSVISLDLSGQALLGKLDPALGNIINLQYLDLSGNPLSGTLPETWGAQMQKLRYLAIGKSAVSGSLPVAWGTNGSFPSLLSLQVSDSPLMGGRIPPTWGTGGMPKLKSLRLGACQYVGTIPAEFAVQLPHLSSFNVSYNRLSGVLPAEWSALPLSNIDVQFNQLTGSLPVSWGSGGLPNLQTLFLRGNSLTGTLPATWGSKGSMGQLTIATLALNRLSGSIPAEWAVPGAFGGRLTRLYLKPGNGAQCGPVPASIPAYFDGVSGAIQQPFNNFNITCVKSNRTLPTIVAAPTGSSGALDAAVLLAFRAGVTSPSAALWSGWTAASTADLCSWTGITCNSAGLVQSLYLAGANVTGALDPGLANLPALQLLDLRYNSFQGSFPEDWGTKMANLRTLRMLGSASGTLPSAWGTSGAFGNLQLLQISQSRDVSGPLPPDWGSSGGMPQLASIDLGGNSLTGPLPNSWGAQLPNLFYVNVTDNKLSGTLPAGWSTLPLTDLEAAVNSFNGSLPAEWGKNSAWPALETLTLGVNKLTGTIPPVWGTNRSMGGLSRLYLLSNSLTGGVPANWAVPDSAGVYPFNQKLIYFVVAPGNTGMCGSIPLSIPAYQDTIPPTRAANFTKPCSAPPPLPSAPPPPASVLVPPGTVPSSTSGVAAADSGGGSSIGIIAGAAAGGILFLLAAILGLFIWRRRRARSNVGAELPPPAALPKSTADSDFQSSLGSGSEAPVLSFHKKLYGSMYATSDGSSNPYDPFSYIPDIPDELAAVDESSLEDRKLQENWEHLGKSGGSSVVQAASKSVIIWELTPERITICKKDDGTDWVLGAGGFGTVYKAWLDGVQEVAVKVLNGTHEEDSPEVAEFAAEVALLKDCKNKNVVQFYGASLEKGNIMMVTEFMDMGNLYEALVMHHRDKLSWQKRGMMVALDVARGLHYLHTNKITHFDIKSPNILLARDGTAKLGDVGLSLILRAHKSHFSTLQNVRGTLDWAAPEVLMDGHCSEKVDIFSFGIVMWELVTGERPQRGRNRPVVTPHECSEEVAEMIKKCCHPDPEQRPSAKDLALDLYTMVQLQRSQMKRRGTL